MHWRAVPGSAKDRLATLAPRENAGVTYLYLIQLHQDPAR
jgi:hypothetical protein